MHGIYITVIYMISYTLRVIVEMEQLPQHPILRVTLLE